VHQASYRGFPLPCAQTGFFAIKLPPRILGGCESAPIDSAFSAGRALHQAAYRGSPFEPLPPAFLPLHKSPKSQLAIRVAVCYQGNVETYLCLARWQPYTGHVVELAD